MVFRSIISIIVKDRLVAQARKVVAVDVDEISRNVGILMLLLTFSIHAQTLPENQLQIDLNSYFDSFNVQVVYPSLSLTKRVSEHSSINARYLVDLVTAASIRSSIHADNAILPTEDDDDGREGRLGAGRVDAITSASGREGSSESYVYHPDDVRHELGFGVTRLLGVGVASLNALYSKESDYRSGTVAGTYTRSFFKNNTSLQLGAVRSWDASSPKIFPWTRQKDEINFSVGVTQVWTKRLISQAIFSRIKSRGILSDPYEVVTIIQDGQTLRLEQLHPDGRIREALGLRMNYKIKKDAALHLGVRYYWDDWDIRSLTSTVGWDKHLNDVSTLHFGLRNYFQSRAFFFKPAYDQPEPYMSVDSKLDRGFSNELEFRLTLQGHDRYGLPQFLMNDNIQFNIYVAFYHRHTDSPNWFSNRKDLFSLITNIGVRYHF